MEIITKEMLENGKNDMSINGVILVKDCSFQTTKNGNLYISGTLQSGKIMPYKMWGGTTAFASVSPEDPLSNAVCNIKGKFSEYNDMMSIIIDSFEVIPNADIAPFLESDYNAEPLLNSLVSLLKKNLTANGFELIERIFLSDEELMKRFINEFAAMSHHDNCRSGLAAHTLKVCRILCSLLPMYKNILSNENGEQDPQKKDLLLIGALLHDIGKTVEMYYGVYTKESFVTHRIIGLEFLLKHKDEFLLYYNEEWFRHLEAIMSQHHDDYGEPCKTVYSFIIHQVDELDSMLTLVNQLIPEAAITPAGKTIKAHERRLNFM